MADHKIIVPDSSVLLKWGLSEEADSIIALKLRRDFLDKKISLVIPDFAYYEVANVLGKYKPEYMAGFISNLFTFGMSEYVLNLKLIAQAAEIVKSCKGVSFYDAAYHAVAIMMKGTFVTADKRYYKKAKALGHIMLIQDYSCEE